MLIAYQCYVVFNSENNSEEYFCRHVIDKETVFRGLVTSLKSLNGGVHIQNQIFLISTLYCLTISSKYPFQNKQ